MLNKLLNVLKETQSSSGYFVALQKSATDKNSNMWKIMENSKTERNFKSYIKSCHLEETCITNLNQHVTDAEVQRLTHTMMVNQLDDTDKYEDTKSDSEDTPS